MTRTAASAAGATLRLFDRADQDIVELGHHDQALFEAVYRFQHDFRRDPWAGGLRLRQLRGDGRLWAAEVSREYRALLLRLGEDDWLLVSVKRRQDVDRDPARFAYAINPVTGTIEYLDLRSVEEEVLGPEPDPVAGASPLFADLSDTQLTQLGVSELLLPLIRRITTDDALRRLARRAPRHSAEVLLRLRENHSFQDVHGQVTEPVAVAPDTDTDDWQGAAERSQSVVTDDDTLQSVIEEGDFGRWKVFLHPTQERLVRRSYSGPARVSGGPGTGKTIVALHRVQHLVDQLPPGHTRPVLLTTFNKNLANDLRARLLSLGGPQTLSRVDIVHVDQLATRVVREAEPGSRRRRIGDVEALQEWRQMLVEAGENRWDAEFLSDEWNQVILGQAVRSRSDYFRVRRAGRGRSVSRAERAAIWQLAERFAQRLDLRGLETHRQVAERAARLELARKDKIDMRQQQKDARGGLDNVHVESGSGAWLRYRYRHVVVDEAQDLSAAHWRMLRAMVPSGPDDIFLVGDTHQRIYDNQVTLGSLGVHIRGRSARLTLSYRTTSEILRSAKSILDGAETAYDDLDGGDDDLDGFRSVLHGAQPRLLPAQDPSEELDLVVAQVRDWSDVSRESVAICVPTNDLVAEVAHRLARHGIAHTEISRDGPRGHEGVHIGTMYRFKGLEYRRLIIAGVREGLVPRPAVDAWRDTDPLRHRRELTRARSLLFVAATRARDALTLIWSGSPSRFLRPLGVR